MEVAVFVGPGGVTAPMQEPGVIQVYQYTCGIWDLCRSMPFHLNSSRGLSEMRAYMKTVLNFLGECRLFAGLAVTGLPFFEMEKAGFTIWETTGTPREVLDSILEGEFETAEAVDTEASPALVAVPQHRETSPGYYSISLKEIQDCSGRVTSKQVLIPLLQNLDFYELEVTCSHVPPWLEEKILSGQLDAVIERSGVLESRIYIRRQKHDKI